MKGGFRLSMTWLHTWSGLIIGWLLFAIFLTGTAAVFREEITIWMTPERGFTAGPVRAIALAEARLASVAPVASSWTITPPDARHPSLIVDWVTSAPDGSLTRHHEVLNASTGKPERIRETLGGDFFYYFHYRLEQPDRRGWWISGFAAVAMLLLLTTGVIIHRRFFKDFFTFRQDARPKRAWLDAHTIMGVLALPFHVMITYTGLIPILSTVMAAGIIANYAHGKSVYTALMDYTPVRNAFLDQRQLRYVERKPSGERTALAPLGPIVQYALERWEDGRIGRIDVSNPGDRHAVIGVVRHIGDQLSNQPERLSFDGTSGQLLASVRDQGPIVTAFTVMYGLHMARFADVGVRWMYFLLGLVSTAMIGTGLIFWTVKRRAQYGAIVPFGHLLVERINVGIVAGLPVAMAAYMWANRLIPGDLAERVALESRAFYTVWAVMIVFAALRPLNRAWTEAWTIAAVAIVALPVINSLTSNRGLPGSLGAQDVIMASVDVTLLGLGALCAFGAWKTAKHGARGVVEGVGTRNIVAAGETAL